MARISACRFNHVLTFGAAVMLTACGGGGDTTTAPASPVAPVVQQPTAASAVYAGPISGFGSVIVNGMRFDTVGARLSDDDGKSVSLQDLSLGMTVSVNGTTNDTTARGTANSVSLVHGNTGPITAINTTGGTFTVQGVTVKTTAATAYKDVSAFSALVVGDVVEVYGAVQSDNTVMATLVDKEGANYTNRLVGRISGLNTVAQTFQVGAVVVNYAGASRSGVLVNGAEVKVKAAQSPVNGVLTADTIRVSDGVSYGASVATGAYLKLKGVAEAAPVNGLVTVSGTRVNLSQAVYEGGTGIASGAFIEVKGAWDGSVLQAFKVEMERNDRDNDGYADRNELYGAVSAVSGDGSGRFVMNGVTVDVSQAYFKNGTRTQLVVGVPLEVKGVVQGNVFMASKVEFKSFSGSGSSGSSGSDDFDYEQYGQVTNFVSVSSFKINGVQVDASTARFDKGSPGALANGVYVEIKGAQNAQGVFVAREVEFKNGRYND